jgi:cytochrome c553
VTIFKQLDDFRAGKRSNGVMSAIAQALTMQNSADVAAYFANRNHGHACATWRGPLDRQGHDHAFAGPGQG